MHLPNWCDTARILLGDGFLVTLLVASWRIIKKLEHLGVRVGRLERHFGISVDQKTHEQDVLLGEDSRFPPFLRVHHRKLREQGRVDELHKSIEKHREAYLTCHSTSRPQSTPNGQAS